MNSVEDPTIGNLKEPSIGNAEDVVIVSMEEPERMQVEESIDDASTQNPVNTNENDENPTIGSMDEEVLNSVLHLVLQLHSKANFTRSDVFKVTALIINLLQSILELILEKILNCDCESKFIIVRIIKSFITALDSVKNDYGLVKILEKLKLGKNLDDKEYEFTISKETGVIFKDNARFFGDIVNTGMLLPIRFQIKEFLSRHGRLSQMTDLIRNMSRPSETISHILQGSTWAKIRSHFNESQVVIPIGLYTDGIQFNNALGTHTDSADMLYYYFPALLDPFHRDNIHVAGIFRSKYLKLYGNGRCLASLVRELFRLYFDGIDIVIDGKVTNVKIVLCQIIGDNLALNATLEYITGFRGNFYCRICKMSRNEAEQACEEILSKLRTQENYEIDLATNDSSATGVVEDCVFNTLPYLHCTWNLSLDLMHDFFEGIFKYDICKALIHFIDNKYITLNEINERISNFAYGREEMRYIPKILIREHLVKNNLNMSAREAWQFLYLLPLLIGDKIPEDNEVWEMIRTLLKIIEICLGSSFDEPKLSLLASLITRHHTIYKKYFNELKPKMHFITHLPSSIRAMGPPRIYMCLRPESKHQFFKVYAHCTRNRINIAKSFAKKYMLHFAFLLLDNKPYLEIETGKEIPSSYRLLSPEDCLFYKDLNYRGTDYKAGMFLPLFETGVYYLYEIMELTVLSNDISITVRKVGTLSYCSHYESYSLSRNVQQNVEIKNLPLANFNSVPLYIYTLTTSTTKTEFIRPKIFFQQI